MQIFPPLSSTAQALFPELEGLGPVSDKAIALAVGLYGAVLLLGLFVLGGFVVHVHRNPQAWSAGVTRLRARPVAWRDLAILFIALCVGISLAVTLIPVLSSFAPFASESGWGNLLLHSMLFHWLAIAVIVALLFRNRSTWRAWFGTSSPIRRGVLVAGVLSYLAMIPLVFFYSLIYQLLLNAWGYESSVQDIALYLTQDHPIAVRCYFVLLAVVVAPIAEELIFRGVLLPLVARSVSAPMAIVIVSLGFAGLHYHIPSLLPLFVISLGFCCAYIYTGSLAVPMVMHAVFNGVSLGILMILRYV